MVRIIEHIFFLFPSYCSIIYIGVIDEHFRKKSRDVMFGSFSLLCAFKLSGHIFVRHQINEQTDKRYKKNNLKNLISSAKISLIWKYNFLQNVSFWIIAIIIYCNNLTFYKNFKFLTNLSIATNKFNEFRTFCIWSNSFVFQLNSNKSTKITIKTMQPMNVQYYDVEKILNRRLNNGHVSFILTFDHVMKLKNLSEFCLNIVFFFFIEGPV